MVFDIANRLIRLGVPYPLAAELMAQITSGNTPVGPRLSLALSGPMTPGSTVTLTATITGAETPVTSLASVSLTVGGSAVTLSGTGLVRTGRIPAGAMAGASIVAAATAVADGNTISGGATSTVVAIPVAPPVAAGGISDQSWTVGAAVSLNVAADFTGAGITYALAPSSSALPAGLSLSAAGVISGTPTVEATGTIVVRGTNGGGYADTAFGFAVTSAVVPVAPLVSLTSTPTVRIHPSYSVVTEESGRVRSASDLMGLIAVSQIAEIGPRVLTDGLGRKFWRFDGKEYLNVSTALAANNRNCTVFFVGRWHRQQGTIFCLGNVAASTVVGISPNLGVVNSGGIPPYIRGGQSGFAAAVTNKYDMIVGAQMQVMGAVGRTTANGGDRLYINNKVGATGVQSTVTGTTTGAEIGRNPYAPGVSGTWAFMDLYEIIVWDRGLTNAEADVVAAELTAGWDIPEIEHQLVCEGDSITFSYGQMSSENCAMSLTEPGSDRALPANWRAVNLGMSGNTIEQIQVRRDANNGWASQMFPTGQNVLAWQGGGNNFGSVGGGQTPTQVRAAALAYLNTETTGVLQRGWTVRQLTNIANAEPTFFGKVVEFRTMLRDPSWQTDLGTAAGGAFEGKYSLVNTDLIALGGDTLFQTQADANDETYYRPDGVHPNALGDRYMWTGGDDPTTSAGYGLTA